MTHKGIDVLESLRLYELTKEGSSTLSQIMEGFLDFQAVEQPFAGRFVKISHAPYIAVDNMEEFYSLKAAEHATIRHNIDCILKAEWTYPVKITPADLKVALWESDTLPGWECAAVKARVMTGELLPVDLFFYTGDYQKFISIFGEYGCTFLSDNLSSVMQEIMGRKREASVREELKDFITTPAPYLQGLIWKLNIDVLQKKKTHEEMIQEGNLYLGFVKSKGVYLP